MDAPFRGCAFVVGVHVDNASEDSLHGRFDMFGARHPRRHRGCGLLDSALTLLLPKVVTLVWKMLMLMLEMVVILAGLGEGQSGGGE